MNVGFYVERRSRKRTAVHAVLALLSASCLAGTMTVAGQMARWRIDSLEHAHRVLADVSASRQDRVNAIVAMLRDYRASRQSPDVLRRFVDDADFVVANHARNALKEIDR